MPWPCGLLHPDGEQWWASESTVGNIHPFSKRKDGKWRFLPGHVSLRGGENLWEGFFNVMPYLQFVDHRPFSYRFSGTSNTYFGDRVAFVLCSIWMHASTDQQPSCGYSSRRERKVFVMSSLPLLDPFPPIHFHPHLILLSFCRRVLIYSEILVLNFNLWSGSSFIILN